MRKLTIPEIEKLASRKGVRRIAVENFLMSVTANPNAYIARLNLNYDARLYKWNSATVRAIRSGIKLSGGGTE